MLNDAISKKAFVVLADPYGSDAAAALKNSDLVATHMPNWYNVYGLQANAPDQKGLWRARLLPKFSQGGHEASTLGGTGFAVGKDLPNTEAALELLKATYLTKEGQLIRFREGGYLPTITDYYEEPEFLEAEDPYLANERIFEVYGAAAQDLPTYYLDPKLPDLTEASSQPLLDLFQGASTPEATLDAIVQGFNPTS
jgi:arabinosaccharide transport system substrate-binding protein